MKKILKWFLFLLTFIPITSVLATSEAEMEEMRNAVLEIMQSYYRKGVAVQYDSYRRNTHFLPEDATPQSYIYTVCSGYPNMVYYQAFGVYVSPYTDYMGNNAKRYQDNPDVIPFFVDGTENANSINGIGASTADIDSVIDRLKPNIKVGDIFVVRQEGGYGHAMIFGELDENGEPYIYESGGRRYDIEAHTENFETKGSLAKVTFRKILERYIKSAHRVERVAIIRFINSNNKYITRQWNAEIENHNGLTDSAKSRLKYPGMDINKTSNIINDNNNNTRNSVTPGDIIEYKIEIKNNSTKNYNNLVVSEVLDENVELIDKNEYNISNREITFNIDSIPAGESKEITYKVKVKDILNVLGKYIVSTGFVDKIKNRTINLYVTESLNKTEQNKLLEKYEEIKDSSSKKDIDFLIDLYEQSLNLDISFLSGKTFKQLVTHNGCNDSSCKVYVQDDKTKEITLGNYYNIRLGAATINDDGNIIDDINTTTDLEIKAVYGWYIYNIDDLTTRPRELVVSDFEIGDIILARKETSDEMYDKAYIYIGDGKLIRKLSTVTEYSDGSNGKSTMQAILNSFNEDNYIVLRPAMLINRNRIYEMSASEPKTSNQKEIEKEGQKVSVPDTLRQNSILIIVISILLLGSGIFVITKNKKNNSM